MIQVKHHIKQRKERERKRERENYANFNNEHKSYSSPMIIQEEGIEANCINTGESALANKHL